MTTIDNDAKYSLATLRANHAAIVAEINALNAEANRLLDLGQRAKAMRFMTNNQPDLNRLGSQERRYRKLIAERQWQQDLAEMESLAQAIQTLDAIIGNNDR